jgi:hypothetical protein
MLKAVKKLSAIRKNTATISKLINIRTSIVQHIYCDYDFSGSDDDFLGFYDE